MDPESGHRAACVLGITPESLQEYLFAPITNQSSREVNQLCYESLTPKILDTHPETSSRGGGGLIPEMIQVCDYDILIVLVELNTLI